MHITFRADSSFKIGTGHIMRCLALANHLRNEGYIVKFICADLDGNLIDVLHNYGYTVVILPNVSSLNSDYRDESEKQRYEFTLGVSWKLDAQQTCDVLKADSSPSHILIVDHYALDYRWEIIIAPYVQSIVVIDDLADRLHHCDLLIDQNMPSDKGTRYRKKVPGNTVVLTGPEYALLRPEFIDARSRMRRNENRIKDMLIMFGGYDATKETLKALLGTISLNLDIDVTVIMSSGNSYLQNIQEVVFGVNNVTLVVQPNNIATIMAGMDFALGAGGITLWERCAVKLPSSSTIVAENQRDQVVAAVKEGLTMFTGEAKDTTDETYSEIVYNVQNNPSLLKTMSKTCGQYVDGMGVERVCTYLAQQSGVNK